MALPYPEGEVYFKRSALELAESDFNFDPDDLKSFNTRETNACTHNLSPS